MSGTTKAIRTSATIAVTKCGCESPFQDERYGKGLRMHNLSIRAGDEKKLNHLATCTVCATQRQVLLTE